MCCVTRLKNALQDLKTKVRSYIFVNVVYVKELVSKALKHIWTTLMDTIFKEHPMFIEDSFKTVMFFIGFPFSNILL